MLKGGYQILNFDGIDIVENTDINIPNIYVKLMQTNKPILVSGFSIYRDTFVSVEMVEESFTIKDFYGYNITINKHDIVRCVKSNNAVGINPIFLDIIFDPAEPIMHNLTGIYNIVANYTNNPLIIVIFNGEYQLIKSVSDGDGDNTKWVTIVSGSEIYRIQVFENDDYIKGE